MNSDMIILVMAKLKKYGRCGN